MNANEQQDRLNDLADMVLQSAFEVSNALGAGFLEKVYQKALQHELNIRGIEAKTEVGFPVFYKGHRVADYYADILVEQKLILELKCVEHLGRDHLAQCINYLRASDLNLCLLLNFQNPKVEWKRVVWNF